MLEPHRREEARDARAEETRRLRRLAETLKTTPTTPTTPTKTLKIPTRTRTPRALDAAGLYSPDIAVNNCSFDGGSTGERFGMKALLAALGATRRCAI